MNISQSTKKKQKTKTEKKIKNKIINDLKMFSNNQNYVTALMSCCCHKILTYHCHKHFQAPLSQGHSSKKNIQMKLFSSPFFLQSTREVNKINNTLPYQLRKWMGGSGEIH